VKIKFYRLLVLTIALILCFSSCGSDTVAPAEDTGTKAEPISLLADDGTCRYVVVKPEGQDAIEQKAAIAVINAIKETLGVSSVDLTTDWLNEKKNETPGEYEILIGGTNRQESTDTKTTLDGKTAYTVKVIGKKICIAGGTQATTLKAAEKFAEIIKTNKGVFEHNYVLLEHCEAADLIAHIKGESGFVTKTLADGVYYTHYSLPEGSTYGKQEIYTVEFDPKQSNLKFEIVQNGTYATSLTSTKSLVEKLNAANTTKTILAAVNGDLWMTSSHSRRLGSTDSYKDCTDVVTTKTLTVPRGFDVYNGEIITSAHMQTETPYEGEFYSFGITEDGKACLGNPQVEIKIKRNGADEIKADGLNRLPANNSLVMYTDAIKTNYCLDEAYEIVIDCGSYKVCHGAKITGTVKKIIPAGTATEDIAEGEIRLTARGTKISTLGAFVVGDTVEITVSVTDKMGNNEVWQNMKNAVGGHIPLIIDGKSQNSTNKTVYPMTVLGIKADGTVVMLAADGRGAGGATGFKICDADELCSELGIVTAFLLDGGGSTELVLNENGKAVIVNNPSDGEERSVVNSVILSMITK